MPALSRILIIEDDRAVGGIYQAALLSCGHEVRWEERGDAGADAAEEEQFDAVLSDVRLPGLDGLGVLDRLHRSNPRVPVILLTGQGSAETAIEAMKRGAYDYLLKPVQIGELIEVVQKAVANSRIRSQEVRVGGRNGEGISFVGHSEAMQRVFKEIGRVAARPVTVLIRGETGTGKELAAQAIYQHGDRRDRPFVVVNCAAIPETLLESELFGHERGAFTGAQARRIGRFEQAHEGTLFLDEIGELTPGTQSKLLRALQERVIQRLGSNDSIPVDVRVLAATNLNLEQAIQERLFREDLYYRLSDATVRLPPLRERPNDISELVAHFIVHQARDLGLQQPGITPRAVEYLQKQAWPGNVRQLQSFVRQAILASRGYAISLEMVQALVGEPSLGRDHATPLRDEVARALDRAAADGKPAAYAEVMRFSEREIIMQAIARSKGNQSLAARWLGISRLTLRNKLAELGRASF
ncbi:MAG: sigma-54 dependent transcriptional regulator [Verrucomicrobium sp.]|nr:sigma-54 dependent transcriptional regulator [Verrucomicrobium sp.]